MAALSLARNVYLDTLNQVRMLCLFALIFIHALSFSTSTMDFPIRELTGLIPIYFLSGLNALFILLTGITFRLILDSKIQKSRLHQGTFLEILNPLTALLMIETLKDILLDQRLAALLNWNFLKTLWLGWILIYLLSRLNIYLNILAAGAMTWFFPYIKQWVLSFENVGGFNESQVYTWSQAHSNLWLYGLGFAFVAAWQIHKSSLNPFLKKSGWYGIGFLILAFAVAITRFVPDQAGYSLAMNWWLWGLVGDSNYYTIMPLLVWGPSYLIGFGGAHFVLKNATLLKKIPPTLFFLTALVLSAVLFKFLILDHLEWLFSLLTNATWNEFSNAETNLGFETFKVAMFATVYLFFLIINKSFEVAPLADMARKWGQASFWIYIAATSWSRLSAEWAYSWTPSLPLVVTISFLSTLGLSYLIVQGLDFFGRKRIFFTLKKTSA